jgi:hypothetical protein
MKSFEPNMFSVSEVRNLTLSNTGFQIMSKKKKPFGYFSGITSVQKILVKNTDFRLIPCTLAI